MNKILLENYLNKLTKEDIYNYGLKHNITIDNYELDILNDYIKNRYNDIINNPLDILEELKDKISDKVYSELVNIYNKYKDKLILFK